MAGQAVKKRAKLNAPFRKYYPLYVLAVNAFYFFYRVWLYYETMSTSIWVGFVLAVVTHVVATTTIMAGLEDDVWSEVIKGKTFDVQSVTSAVQVGGRPDPSLCRSPAAAVRMNEALHAPPPTLRVGRFCRRCSATSCGGSSP